MIKCALLRTFTCKFPSEFDYANHLIEDFEQVLIPIIYFICSKSVFANYAQDALQMIANLKPGLCGKTLVERENGWQLFKHFTASFHPLREVFYTTPVLLPNSLQNWRFWLCKHPLKHPSRRKYL